MTALTHGPATEAEGLADLNQAAEALWLAVQQADLPEAWRQGFSVEVLAEVGSTNTCAMTLGRNAESGAAAPAVVVAWQQTAGRGRAGRSWQAQPGHTLTCSLGLPLNLDAVPGGGSALSLAAGLAVAEALRTLPGHPPVQLKWPNDLQVAGRKLGGLLIEAQAPAHLPAGERWVVIGLGLNLGPTPHEQQGQRVALADLGCTLTPGVALALLMPALLQAVHWFSQHGFAPLQARWQALHALQGREVALWARLPDGVSPDAPHAPAPDQSGHLEGVNSDGSLRVRLPDGTVAQWQVGDVSVRPQPH
ncbi:biotin--[acetyl-CoA-carboxylase] ligase [Aquabacterium lacunae]|uniref:Biotin--[acetyl-CoA-carboxylase] ligase n=1 Tax=Aquabacterium lacunae TaxID=2528630 RepID=A0A4Q9H0J2_9BURK|nr:biotin--[acetyl-CoA-carboxylase] ligase [Aquabacterium lacunae]TBO31243.1 biotin--[acetyl-CoA-carboxylase] ligase [Aquabacterium lacunae]